MHILELPREIQLLILSILDVSSTLALRQTCEFFQILTSDTFTWIKKFREQEKIHPVDLRYASGFGSAWPTLSELAPAVKLNQRTAPQWIKTRENGPVKLTSRPSPFMGLKILQDRWLICAYNNGSIQVWDLDDHDADLVDAGHPPPTLFLETTPSGQFWTAFSAAVEGDEITIALTRAAGDPTVVLFCTISLISREFSAIEFAVPGGWIKNIDPLHNVLLLATPDSLLIFNYISKQHQTWQIPQGSGAVYEGILDAQFLGPYVLAITTRAVFFIPFYPNVIPASASGISPEVHLAISHSRRLDFLQSTFRSAVLGGSAQRKYGPGRCDYFITIMAYDVFRGLFRFTLTCSLSPDSDTPSLEMSQTGLYSISNIAPPPMAPPPESPQSLLASRNDELHTPTPTPTVPSSLQELPNPSARGFVSTFSIGLQGKRALWVERQRGNTIRKIHVWDASLPLPSSDDPLFPPMSSARIYTINSFDLSDDRIHCALAELTGRIVLGDRAGRVDILDLNRL
ncbi:hypothetical protein BDN72DRAFT_897866 [Pluteus cervinus]|uniref:Uncharacterized protein n=1 Tax=Pluteus cervinus TaxID=181527 RepID=A0ACD3ASN4_9AGAR|nr:hypothetical protein BDN72DRAFT_897866 [Pluteus cervinus]